MSNISKILQVVLIILLVHHHASGQTADRWSVKMAESVMARNPAGLTHWSYVTGTYLRGFEEVWKTTGDTRYYEYIATSLDAVVREDGTINGYRNTEYNIDEIKQGCLVLTLYKNTAQRQYKLAADSIRTQLLEHPRTHEGGFWHKQIYQWQMWLDGLYMGCPYYTEYGRLFGEPEIFEDVVHQITQMEKHARDSSTGLLYHGWDESRNQAWSDPLTGTSANFWGRGMGWYAMAIVDVLDYFPENHEGRDTITGVYQRMAEAIKDFQDPDTKVWWQVLDRGGDTNNYLESSGSCMFVYSMAKAMRLGIIDDSYRQVVLDGYNGIIKEFIETNEDGTINLTKTCAGAGLGGNPYRDGSYEYYTETAYYRTNDGKGVGPFMMASVEIEMMDSLYPVTLLMIDSVSASGVHLGWSMPSRDADSILIERCDSGKTSIIGTVHASRLFFTDTSQLIPGEKYYYRVRCFHSSDTSLASIPAINFCLNEGGLPIKATPSYPQNGQEHVSLNVELKWEEGIGSTSSRIYIGKTNPPAFLAEVSREKFSPGPLEAYTMYYWRVDAVNTNGSTEGETLSFKSQLENQCVGYWTLDETSGSAILDSSGYYNDGSIVNMIPGNRTDGILGGGIRFFGDEYIRIPHNDVLNFGLGSFTKAFYLKQDPDVLDGAEEYRFLLKGSHINDPGMGRTGRRYEVFLNADAKQVRFSIDDDQVKSRAVLDAMGIIDGEWVHFAAGRNAEIRKLVLYVDGELSASADDNTGNIDQPEDLLFGYSEDMGSNLIGYLDEIRLYNYVLDIDEIKGLLIPGSTSSGSGLTGPPGEEIMAFADPVHRKVLVSIIAQNENYARLMITDCLGRRIKEERIDLYSGGSGSNFEFDTSGLYPGVYIISIKAGSLWKSLRFVIFD